MLITQYRRRLQETHTIGNPVAHKKVGKGRYGEIAKNLTQRINLIFVPYRAHFKKGKPGVHGQNHDGTQKNEQRVGAVDQSVHCTLQIFHGSGRPVEKHQDSAE
ncbi:hypothetical protein D3C72_1722240 [compost metagenome]